VSEYFGCIAEYQSVGGLQYFLQMTKYINYLKQSYLDFKQQLMLEIHLWRVYSLSKLAKGGFQASTVV